MATVVTSRDEAKQYVMAHLRQALFVPPASALVFRDCETWPWALVGADGAREERLDMARHVREEDAGAHGVQLVEDTERVVDAIMAAHVVTTDRAELRLLRDGAEPVECDLGQMAQIIGKEKASAAAREALRDLCGNDELLLRIDDYDMGDVRANISHADIDDWLNDVPASRWSAAVTYGHDLDGFVGYMQTRIEEASWYDECRWFWEREAAKRVVHALGEELGKLGLPWLYDYADDPLDADLLEAAREEYVWDSGFAVDPNVEWLMGNYGDVQVDLFLTDGDEANYDFSTLTSLNDVLGNPDGYTEEERDDLLSNNGLSWLAERMGLGRDAPLASEAKEGSARRAFCAELANHSYGSMGAAVITARLSLENWIDVVAARERGDNVTLWGNTFIAGIYDRWGGGGSCLDLDVKDPITIPAKNLWDAALDGTERTYNRSSGPSSAPWPPMSSCAALASRGYGYTIADVYGVGEDLWRRGRAASDDTIARRVAALMDAGALAIERLPDGRSVVSTQDRVVWQSYLPARFADAAVATHAGKTGNVILSPSACEELEEMLATARARACRNTSNDRG